MAIPVSLSTDVLAKSEIFKKLSDLVKRDKKAAEAPVEEYIPKYESLDQEEQTGEYIPKYDSLETITSEEYVPKYESAEDIELRAFAESIPGSLMLSSYAANVAPVLPVFEATAFLADKLQGGRKNRDAMNLIHSEFADTRDAAREPLEHLPWYQRILADIFVDIVPTTLAAYGTGAVSKLTRIGKIAAGLAPVALGEKTLREIMFSKPVVQHAGAYMLKKGLEGGIFSMLFDIARAKKIDPEQALLFAGIDATVPVGLKFLKFSKAQKSAQKSVAQAIKAKADADIVAKELDEMTQWKDKVNKSIQTVQGELFTPAETFSPVTKVNRTLGEVEKKVERIVKGRKVVEKPVSKANEQIDLFYEKELPKPIIETHESTKIYHATPNNFEGLPTIQDNGKRVYGEPDGVFYNLTEEGVRGATGYQGQGVVQRIINAFIGTKKIFIVNSKTAEIYDKLYKDTLRELGGEKAVQNIEDFLANDFDNTVAKKFAQKLRSLGYDAVLDERNKDFIALNNKAVSIVNKVSTKETRKILPYQQEEMRLGDTFSPAKEVERKLGELDVEEKVEVLGRAIKEQYEKKSTGETLDLFFDHDLKDRNVGLSIKKPRSVVDANGKFDAKANKLLRDITAMGKKVGLVDEKGNVSIEFVKLVKEIGFDFKKAGGVNSITVGQGKALLKTLENYPKRFLETSKALENVYSTATVWSKITPSLRYVFSLNAWDLVGGGVKAKFAMDKAAIDSMEYLTNTVKMWRKAVGHKDADRMLWETLDKFDTAEAAGLTGDQALAFRAIRNYTDAMLANVNKARLAVGLDPINRISGYITHIFDAVTKKKLRAKYPFPVEAELALERTSPKEIFNPTAEVRKNLEEGLLKDPLAALRMMTHYNLKDIYLSQPNQVFREQFQKLVKAGKMPATTAKWLQAFWNQTILGFPTDLDKLTEAAWDKLGFVKAIDMLNMAMGIDSYKTFSSKIRETIMLGSVWGSARQSLRNLTQVFQTAALYGTKAFRQSLEKTPPELEAIMKENVFLQEGIGKFLDIDTNAMQKLIQLGYASYKWSQKVNARNAFKAGYYAAKNLGWTEQEAIREAEFAVMTTQYFYNKIGMPELFRSELGKNLFVLQSWWMHYTMGYWREMLVRMFKGETGYGKKIPASWRAAALRHTVGSLTFIEAMKQTFGLDYSQIALFGALPSGMSPTGQLLIGMMEYLGSGGDDRARAEAKNKMALSLKVFIPGRSAARDASNMINGDFKRALFYPEKVKTLDYYEKLMKQNNKY